MSFVIPKTKAVTVEWHFHMKHKGQVFQFVIMLAFEYRIREYINTVVMCLS